MAYSTIAQTLGAAQPEPSLVQLVAGYPTANGILNGPDSTAVAAAVATLVADGATPTQAHVTALNTAWGTLLTNSTAKGDVIVLVNPTNVPTLTKLKRAFDASFQAFVGGLGGLTP